MRHEQEEMWRALQGSPDLVCALHAQQGNQKRISKEHNQTQNLEKQLIKRESYVDSKVSGTAYLLGGCDWEEKCAWQTSPGGLVPQLNCGNHGFEIQCVWRPCWEGSRRQRGREGQSSNTLYRHLDFMDNIKKSSNPGVFDKTVFWKNISDTSDGKTQRISRQGATTAQAGNYKG